MSNYKIVAFTHPGMQPLIDSEGREGVVHKEVMIDVSLLKIFEHSFIQA